MPNTKFTRLFLLAAFLFLLLLSGCVQTTDNNHFKAVKGYLDLSGWDFNTQGPAPLDGEWEFYQHSAALPRNPEKILLNEKKDFFPLPSIWKGKTAQGIPLTKQGQGTYRLKVKFEPNFEVNSLYISGVLSVCRVWVNGNEIASSGTIGKNKQSEIPRKHFLSPIFPSANGYADIVLEVSNFHNEEGGINSCILLGSNEQIQDVLSYRRISGAILSGVLFIMGLYHLIIFLVRRSNKENLYFGLFCLVWCITTIFNPPSAFLVTKFITMDWSWYIKACLLPPGIAIPLLLIFYHSLFPKKYGKIINWTYSALGGLYIMYILVAPPIAYSAVAVSYFIISRTAYLYLFTTFLVDLFRGKKGVIFLAPGYVALAYSELDEILFDLNIISSAEFGLYGAFIFIISYSIFMSVRFAEALSRVEKISGELEAQKKTEQSHKLIQIRLSKMLDSVDDAILAVNRKYEINFSNRAFTNLTGYHTENLLGQQLTSILSKPDCATVTDFMRKIPQLHATAESNIKQDNFQITTAGGSILNTSALVTLLDVEDELIYTLVLRPEEKPLDKRQFAVWIMKKTLKDWESATKFSKADLAFRSGLWNVYMEKDGYARTQTLDRYLSEETLPSRPRWKNVYATVEFVLANSQLSEDSSSELQKALARLKKMS
ncbi:PAS domain S-box-containing protein [Maridesulfovibrio ferrireducens]|uniref:PAS domain S-box-containing protein n=1 Tax=Maridesulfovibrio ferrireducens TaxID=246191 RepID=A0A1G9BB79_9BACT|nr:7TM diverse intracellular signaling domain-containing protein [Maridesulfovibrio ferrireducens]SDK36314.1 PAS domain S-box-containing protein [Maridesulfovibrio ferrireducens]